MLTTTTSRGGAGGGGLGGAPDRVRGIAETAQLLNISASTLRRLISAGSIRVTRLSARRVGILDSAREAFLRKSST
jgi:excisionase family DNA binding protein